MSEPRDEAESAADPRAGTILPPIPLRSHRIRIARQLWAAFVAGGVALVLLATMLIRSTPTGARN